MTSPAPPAPTFLHTYLPYLLRQADQTLSAAFYSVLAEQGVGRSEWRVLAVLHQLGDLAVADLVTAALSPQPTVTHAVRRLEDRGLVIRRASPTDRRQRIVTITADGRALTDDLITKAAQLEAQILEGWDDAQLSTLIAALGDLTTHAHRKIRP